MQSSIFAIDLVVKDALEKNHELWLVLQDIKKAYDSIGWKHLRKSLVRIKMCNRFIKFFGSIYNGCINRVITDFGLTNRYSVHDGLDQEEVFSSLFWRIFYDTLLCEIKRQEAVVGASGFSMYMDGSLCGLGSVNMKAGTAVFFEDINLGLGVEHWPLSVCLVQVQSVYSLTAKAVLNVCRAELLLLVPDFWNKYWVKCRHIADIICKRNLNVGWYKVKEHLGVMDNMQTDLLAGVSFHSGWLLPPPSWLKKCFILANDSIVSGSGVKIVDSHLLPNVDWSRSSLVWHSNSHMAAGFTSCHSAGSCSYFMKALHHKLSVGIHKCLYDKYYSSVVYLYCGDVKVSDHVFFCAFNVAAQLQLFVDFASTWRVVSGLFYALSLVSQMLSDHLTDLGLVASLYKGFVLMDWYQKATSCFDNSKTASDKMVEFVCTFMEKHSLISYNGSIPVSVSGGMSMLSVYVIRLLGIDNVFGVSFGLHSFCQFFLGISDLVFVSMGV
ncbi:hypothetical protein G9A89_022075 [Geosiphon pyriformis]|nr:hypothetical protein G9A89_022075 [Geosiphon pyriformis]